jgi:hypothetical protein
MIDFLTTLMGAEIVFTRGFFQRTLPGCPGISMHTDGQPHASDLFGYEGSCPRLIRVLYYLDGRAGGHENQGAGHQPESMGKSLREAGRSRQIAEPDHRIRLSARS